MCFLLLIKFSRRDSVSSSPLSVCSVGSPPHSFFSRSVRIASASGRINTDVIGGDCCNP